METPQCDDARPGDYCTEGVVRHIHHQAFRTTMWLCLRHKQQREAMK